MPASTDPLADARTLAAAASRRHPCCQDLATACDKCWLPLLAERVALSYLDLHGQTFSDGDRSGGETVKDFPDDDTLVRG